MEGSGRSSGAEIRKSVVARVAPMATNPTTDTAFFHVKVSTHVTLLVIVMGATASLEDAKTAFWSFSWKDERWTESYAVRFWL